MFDLPTTKPKREQLFKPVTITMPGELLERVDRVCEVTGRSRSDVMRALLTPTLEKVESQAP
jgi:metal-responsive CopG/Arc/MetJ family transcriptional regulator